MELIKNRSIHSRVGLTTNGILNKTHFFTHRLWTPFSRAPDSAIYDGNGFAAFCYTKFSAGSRNRRRMGLGCSIKR